MACSRRTYLLERVWLSIWFGGGGLSRPSLHIHNRLGVCVCSVFGLVAFGYYKLEKEACYWKRCNTWRTVMPRKIKLSSGATFSYLLTTLLVCNCSCNVFRPQPSHIHIKSPTFSFGTWGLYFPLCTCAQCILMAVLRLLFSVCVLYSWEFNGFIHNCSLRDRGVWIIWMQNLF